MPTGYYPIFIEKNRLTVGMDFSHFNQEAIERITFNGSSYKRGSLTIIPDDLVSDCCSCREYYKEKLHG